MRNKRRRCKHGNAKIIETELIKNVFLVMMDHVSQEQKEEKKARQANKLRSSYEKKTCKMI